MDYQKVSEYCHYTGKYRRAAHSICNWKFNLPNEIPVIFHNGSIYDYHFIIKILANEFEGQFECLGENTEKYKTFSVPIEKEITKIDKDGNESVVTISDKIKFIDSARFMATSLSNQMFWIREKNSLLNLINHEPDIDKMYLYGEVPYEVNYQLLINKREDISLKYNQILWMISIKILQNTIQIKNKKY